MSIALHADPVPLRVDESGTIRVGQSRVTLDVVIEYWGQGMPAEEIARGLDTITLADVHGALAYYFRHRSEIDGYLRQRQEGADMLRREIEAANAPRLAALKSRVDDMRANRNDGHAPTAV